MSEKIPFEEIKRKVAPACHRYKVKRLDLFGSATRKDDAPVHDLDFLVEFDNFDKEPSKRFFGLLHSFEDTFHCKIDLLTPDCLKNPYFREKVQEEKVNLYEG
ncbi:MAG: nucleotidyltransferase family protein [Desulfococcaceae bacterium]